MNVFKLFLSHELYYSVVRDEFQQIRFWNCWLVLYTDVFKLSSENVLRPGVLHKLLLNIKHDSEGVKKGDKNKNFWYNKMTKTFQKWDTTEFSLLIMFKKQIKCATLWSS